MKRIKHFFLGLLVMFLFFIQVNAQPEIGLVMGLNNNKFTGDSPLNGKYKSNLGFLVSIHIDFKLSDYVRLSFQPGLRSGGGKVAFANPDEQKYKDSLKINATILTLPLVLKITSLSERVYFLGGFSVDFPSKIQADNEMEKVDISDELKKFNISAQFGLGYRIPIQSTVGYIELRYLQGLVNITDRLEDDEAYLPRVKTTATQLLIGWQIPLTKNN